MCCFGSVIAGWSANTALGMTSVSSVTVLSNMSGAHHSLTVTAAFVFTCFPGFFTLGIGRMFRVETLTASKVCAVVIR